VKALGIYLCRTSEITCCRTTLDKDVPASSGRSRSAYGTRPRPKIIVLTNFGLSEFRRAAELFGVEAFLDKACEYFRLPSLLTDFAKQHAVQDPH
jgi:hypothetical protein